MSTAKGNEAYDAFLALLQPETRAAMRREGRETLPVAATPEPAEDDDNVQYQEFLKVLQPETRAAMTKPKPEPTEPQVPTEVARWGIVESPDGEWAQMRLFKSAEGLARRLQQLEGQDVVAWCFFGVPLKLTKGPQRVLLLPGEKTAIQIPLYDGGPCTVVPVADPDELVFEKTGYVGPRQLAEAPPSKEALEAKAAVSGDDDDD